MSNNNKFNWKCYLELNEDLKQKGITDKKQALYHWLKYGIDEQRPYSFLNNTFVHTGRFGNLFFVNMVLHFISIKYNLKCMYKYYNKYKLLGIEFHVGENEYEENIYVTDENFFDIIQNTNSISKNIRIDNDSWFQKKFFCDYLKQYFEIPHNKLKITNQNKYKKRYNNNNDLFIHIRLGDVEDTMKDLYDYFNETIYRTEFVTGYISSDTIEHKICKKLIEKYNLIIIDMNEVDTIMFASTCNNIILSGGTFSWLIGFLAFYSKNIFYPKIQEKWYSIDIFDFKNWDAVIPKVHK